MSAIFLAVRHTVSPFSYGGITGREPVAAVAGRYGELRGVDHVRGGPGGSVEGVPAEIAANRGEVAAATNLLRFSCRCEASGNWDDQTEGVGLSRRDSDDHYRQASDGQRVRNLASRDTRRGQAGGRGAIAGKAVSPGSSASTTAEALVFPDNSKHSLWQHEGRALRINVEPRIGGWVVTQIPPSLLNRYPCVGEPVGQRVAHRAELESLDRLRFWVRSPSVCVECRERTEHLFAQSAAIHHVASSALNQCAPKSWHETAVDKWCALRGGQRNGFARGVKTALVSLTPKGSGRGSWRTEIREVFREPLGFFPDAWVSRAAPEESWADHQIVVCEVWDSSPLSKHKCELYADLFWTLDTFVVELVVEIVDRTESIRRLDILDLAYKPQEHWAQFERPLFVGTPETLKVSP